ncbi:DUF4375 domain-containing protein [Paenibacillus sp. GCM10027629]|uniref:DMP19 family protein n=1 Tax=Paenibacillus sp. GCM10027629 TaxID=3273414 RepID=UPI00362DD544
MKGNLKETIELLLPINNLPYMSSEELIGHIALNIYKNEFIEIRDQLDFIPEVLKNIILLIDFDTELNMNGIIGFLENSSGLYLNETIDVLRKTSCFRDMNIMVTINNMLLENAITIEELRIHVNSQVLYQISNSTEKHGEKFTDVLMEIENKAGELYLYRNEENIFDNLIYYVETNKGALLEEIIKMV